MSKRFQKVYVEISNVCNLQCSFCPEVERERNFMAPELFTRVIGQVAPLTEEVCFHLMGEPLGHPRFAQYVEICSQAPVRVNITTNGTLLDEKKNQALLQPIISQVNFSIQSFQANFPGKNMNAYLEKIFRFTEMALETRPDLYVNYRLWNLRESQLATGHGAGAGMTVGEGSVTNEELWEKIRKRFLNHSSESVSLNGVDVRRRKNLPVKGRFSLHFDTRFEWPNPSMAFRTNQGFCHGLGSHIGILADGTAVPCCLDKEGRISLGNCGRQSLEEILKSDRAQAMSKGFSQGQLTESLCQKCTFISRFDKKAEKLRKRSVDAADVVVTAEFL